VFESRQLPWMQHSHARCTAANAAENSASGRLSTKWSVDSAVFAPRSNKARQSADICEFRGAAIVAGGAAVQIIPSQTSLNALHLSGCITFLSVYANGCTLSALTLSAVLWGFSSSRCTYMPTHAGLIWRCPVPSAAAKAGAKVHLQKMFTEQR